MTQVRHEVVSVGAGQIYVGVNRGADKTVAQLPADHLDGCASAQGDRCKRVPQVMDPEMRESGLLQNRQKRAPDVVMVIVPAV